MATTEYSYGAICKPLVAILKTSYDHLKFKIAERCLNDEIPKEAEAFF